MKIIDAHNHVEYLGFDADAAVRNMDENDIAQTWLLTWEAPDGDINPDMYMRQFHPNSSNMSFEQVRDAVRRYPNRFIAGYCPDPRRPDALDRLSTAYEHYGVRVCGELKHRVMYDNPDCIELYRLCGRYRLPVVLHLDYPIALREGYYPRRNYWFGGGIEALERALEQVPETTFVGHAPGFWARISADDKYLSNYYPEGPIVPGGKVIALLERFPNLYADLSAGSALNALSRDPGFAERFIEQFQDRLLYGRDNYSTELREFLDGLALSEEVREKVFHRNAEKLIAESASDG
jgi:predicted TIM-barrel fold metal-dependent hydrolase